MNKVNAICLVKGNLLCSASVDKTIRVWDLKTEKCLRMLTGHTKPITSIITLTKSLENFIVSGSEDKRIIVWDPTTSKYSLAKRCIFFYFGN